MSWPSDSNSNPLLFLDFDGVLHPIGSPDRYFARLPLLENLLRGDGKAWQVVISSSWREFFSLQQLRCHFSSDLRARIVGMTPADDDKFLHANWGGLVELFPREIQIRQYLAQRGLVDCNWVALDDNASWFREGAGNPHLVLCQSKTGLTSREVEIVRQRLNGLPPVLCTTL